MSSDKKKLLGEVLLEKHVIKETDVIDALAESEQKKVLLGSILIEQKVISEKDLHEALEEQKHSSRRLGDILVTRGMATQKEITRAFSMQLQSRQEPCEEAPAQRLLLAHLKKARIPIHVRLAALITVLIILITSTASYFLYSSQKEEFLSQTIRFGSAIISNLSYNCSIPLLENDDASLNTLLEEVSKMQDISYVMVLDKNGVVKAHSDIKHIDRQYEPVPRFKQLLKTDKLEVVSYREGENEVLDFMTPVKFSQVHLGTIHAGISLNSLRHKILRFGKFVLILTIVLVIIGIGVTFFISKQFSRPIIELVHGTTEIKHGNFSYRSALLHNDELGDLTIAFNEMAEGLAKKEIIQDAFGKYVNPEIVDMILNNPDSKWFQGKKLQVTVMFTDIRGFTSFSETNEPEEVVAVLNDHFTTVTEIIISHGGHVDKFIGDAVLAVFGALMEYDDHAQRAVRAAIFLQKALQKENESKRRTKIQIGIGINSGAVIAGNIGSQQRMEYTVIGDTVNLASRLTDIAGPDEIIVSSSTYARATDVIRARKLDPVSVKGKKEPIEIYRVEGLR